MILRRDFITLLGGVAAWPLAARAQQGDRVRRIGVLLPTDENDPVAKTMVSAFTQGFAGLGWTDGRNVQIDYRWGRFDSSRIRALAQELVGLQPDIILTGATATVAVQRQTRTIPIVSAAMADPVATGLVPRLNQPGGNITGFALFEPSLGGKWLQLLTEIAPELKRAAFMFNPDTPHQLICPRLRGRPGYSRSCQSLRPFTATQKSTRPSSPLGASREAALSSCRIHSPPCIARGSYRRRLEATYRRSLRFLSTREKAGCSPTDPT
jgi:hypothetical protein